MLPTDTLEDPVALAQADVIDTCRADHGLPLMTPEERAALLNDLRDPAVTAAIAFVERQMLARLDEAMALLRRHRTVAIPTGDAAGTFRAVRRHRR